MINTERPLLLIVEDSDEDYEATVRALKVPSTQRVIHRCVHGDDALDFLYAKAKYSGQQTKRPALILLDLNLPGTDGREVLEEIKSDEKLKTIPVVILSTSSNPSDIETSYRNGASSYIVKPVNYPLFEQNIQIFEQYWFKVITLPI